MQCNDSLISTCTGKQFVFNISVPFASVIYPPSHHLLFYFAATTNYYKLRCPKQQSVTVLCVSSSVGSRLKSRFQQAAFISGIRRTNFSSLQFQDWGLHCLAGGELKVYPASRRLSPFWKPVRVGRDLLTLHLSEELFGLAFPYHRQ